MTPQTTAPPASRPQPLDPAALAVGPAGVAGMVWPVARHELIAVRDRLLLDLTELARDRARTGDDSVAVLRASLANTVMGCFQAQCLVRRLGERGLVPVGPTGGPYIQPIAQGGVPGVCALRQALRQGPPRRSRLRAPLRLLREWRNQHQIRLQALRNDGDGAVTTTVTGGLAERHAAHVALRPVYQAFDQWFGPAGSWAPDAATGDACLDRVRAAFAAGGETLAGPLEAWLRDLLAQACGLVKGHVAGAERAKLPRDLWTGTGGSLWNQMLRQAVRRAGGRVTGHDHGGGHAYFRQGTQALVDLDAADRFVATNQAQADALRSHPRPDLMVQPAMPEILALPPPPPPERANATGPVRDVLVMIGYYLGDRFNMVPLIPDIVAVDWQARLLAHLGGQGYRLWLKPHPECPVPLPPALVAMARDSGGDVIAGRFEDILGLADLILFDMPLTSTFRAALRSAKAVVLVDVGLEPWLEGAAAAFDRRIVRVPAGFDGDNRLMLDWAVLDDALARAPSLAADDSLIASYAA